MSPSRIDEHRGRWLDEFGSLDGAGNVVGAEFRGDDDSLKSQISAIRAALWRCGCPFPTRVIPYKNRGSIGYRVVIPDGQEGLLEELRDRLGMAGAVGAAGAAGGEAQAGEGQEGLKGEPTEADEGLPAEQAERDFAKALERLCDHLNDLSAAFKTGDRELFNETSRHMEDVVREIDRLRQDHPKNMRVADSARSIIDCYNSFVASLNRWLAYSNTSSFNAGSPIAREYWQAVLKDNKILFETLILLHNNVFRRSVSD